MIKVCRWVAIGSVVSVSFASAGNVVIDTPLGGWRNSGNEKLRFTQEVHYPASGVNTPEGTSQAALIKGRILGAAKSGTQTKKGGQKPAAPLDLVVNGLKMPISHDGTQFSRPYMFGAGSNNVEVKDSSKSDRARVQFYESSSAALTPKLSVLLSWDTDQTDLDIHLISPDGEHCFYGNRVLENGLALDVDVTTGFGPEMISSTSPASGLYLVYVNYYGSGGGSDLTVANVTVVFNQNTVDERRETVTVPMRRSGDLTQVHSFVLK